MPTLRELGAVIHKTAVEHGWWEQERNPGEIYMNIASEVSEAWEEWRAGRPGEYYVSAKPEGEGIELADCIIRILDYAHHKGWDMEHLILTKMAYNETRPYRHGGKRA